ncbi:hypothetical protein [Chthonobacter rhizosphaerae]|uniref:hypothetical protein n=1 Tax=Chthonobacter rhizosphaerae TaxID=2735553 RepID=UPI0015EE770E|nr:hypothetical protein [Chthonobacter rhizosphaerae]
MFIDGFYRSCQSRRPARRVATTASTWMVGPARLSVALYLMDDDEGPDCPVVELPLAKADEERSPVFYRDPLL